MLTLRNKKVSLATAAATWLVTVTVSGPLAMAAAAETDAQESEETSATSNLPPELQEDYQPKKTADEKELKRVLTLRNGSHLRAKSRLKDGEWQVRQSGKWQSLPANSVQATAIERELLREWKQLNKAQRSDQTSGQHNGSQAAHLEKVEWARTRGLRQEALETLEELLARSPHNAQALEHLRNHRYVAVPSLQVSEDQMDAALRKLYDWAHASPRWMQELAAFEFERVKDREGFQADVIRALGSPAPTRRAFSSHLLGRLYPGEEVKRLLAHAALDTSVDARRAASHALSVQGEEALALPMIRSLDSNHSVVRANAAESLGNMGFAAAVPALVSHLATAQSSSRASHVARGSIFVGKQRAYIQDFDVEVAQFQSIADPQVNVLLEGATTTAGVLATRQVSTTTELVTARRALTKLTGHEAHTSRAWVKWWQQEGPAWAEKHGVQLAETPGQASARSDS